MNKKPIVVLGGGGHGKVLIYTISKLPGFKLFGYLDKENRGPILGFPYIGQDSEIPFLIEQYGEIYGALGIGNTIANDLRIKLMERAIKAGMAFPPIIAKGAIVSHDISIGQGSVVFDGAIVQPGTSIGCAVIINTRASVDHDCVLMDGAHICPGSTLSGSVTVGSCSLVGVGASIIHSVSIGANVTIGAGATVIRDALEPGVYAGVPARRIR